MNSDTALRGAYNFEFVNFGYGGDANIAVLDTTPTGDAGQKAVKLNTGEYDVTFNGAITGAGSLIKTGGGMLAIGGTHAIGGQLAVDQGRLALAAGSSATAAAGIAINPAGILELQGDASVDGGSSGVTFAPGSQFTPNGHTLTVAGAVEVQSNSIINLDASDIGKIVLAGDAINGSFNNIFYEMVNDGTQITIAKVNMNEEVVDALTDVGIVVGTNSGAMGFITSTVNQGKQANPDSAVAKLAARLENAATQTLMIAGHGDTETAQVAFEQIVGSKGAQTIEAIHTVNQNFANSIFSHLSQLRDANAAMNAMPVQSGGALASRYATKPETRPIASGPAASGRSPVRATGRTRRATNTMREGSSF